MDKHVLGQSLGVTTVCHVDDEEMVIEELGDAQGVLDLMQAIRNSGVIVERPGIGRLMGSIDPVVMQGLKKKYPELNYLNTPEGERRLRQIFREYDSFAASDSVRYGKG